jgi:hypothetical protein
LIALVAVLFCVAKVGLLFGLCKCFAIFFRSVLQFYFAFCFCCGFYF